MKKLFIVAVLCFFGLTQLNAQVSFKPGLRGGANFAHFTKGDFNNNYYYYDFDPAANRTDYKTKTDFYIGLYGALHLTKYYTLQPEINYSRQGSNVEYYDGSTRRTTKVDLGYLSVGMINKFTFTDKFNFHLGPTIDFIVDKPMAIARNVDSDVDLAFTAGFGYNFTKNFGIEGRVKKGIISAYYNSNYSDGNHTNVVFSVGGTYTFDIK
jgi:hypothetical protein